MKKESQMAKVLDGYIKDLFEELKSGHTESYQKYLEQKAKFHKYSWGNCILMWWQRHDVEQVAGYKQWQKMGYQVKKGANAIWILAPYIITYIVRETKDGKEDIYWKDMTDEEKKAVTKHQKILRGYLDVKVFDIKDTTAYGKIQTKMFYPLGNDNETMWKLMLKAFTDSGLPIYEGDTGSSEGYCSDTEIVVSNRTDANNKILYSIHEVAHWKLKQIKDYKKTYSYAEGELQAEGISYVVAQYLGFNNPFSADYILSWMRDEGDIFGEGEENQKKALDKFKANMNLINDIAGSIIDELEKQNVSNKLEERELVSV